MEFTTEQMEKAKNCKTLDEFKDLAKAEGFDFSDEEAKEYFAATHSGELNDDELNAVVGGKTPKRPDPKFNIGDRVYDIGRYMATGRNFFREGIVKDREYSDSMWVYTISNGTHTRNVREEILVRR